MQEKLNFTTSFYKRTDYQYGYAKVYTNGTIVITKLHANVAKGSADIGVAGYELVKRMIEIY